jgi:hypothetical protein
VHQLLELRLRHHREHQMTLAGGEAVAGRLAGARQIAELPVEVPGYRIFRDLRSEKAQGRIEHRNVGELAFAGLGPLKQRAGDSEGAGHAGDRIAQRKAGAGRSHFLVTGDRHDPRHRLHHAVEGGGLPLRTGLAKARHGAIDQLRIDLAQRLIAEPELLHDAGPEVLPDDVRPLGESPDDLGRFRLGEVERQASFVGVERHE